MVEAPVKTYLCRKCGRRFQGTPALAGRQVRCTCGAMVKFPGKPAAAQTEATGVSKPTVSKPATDSKKIKNLYLPLGLLLGGLAIQIIATLLAGGGLIELGIGVAMQTALMLPCILIAARSRQVSLGPFWNVALKVAALAVGPGAILLIFNPIFMVLPFGWLFEIVLAFITFFSLLGVLFDLEQDDTFYFLCVLFLIHLSIYFFKLWRAHHGGN